MKFVADFQQEAKRLNAQGRCLHFANGLQCDQIISAHSIQKSGQLNLIAESGHVYRLSADLSTLKSTSGIPQPKKIGVNKASTFAGFCKLHDNSLFEAIDNRPLAANRHQVALYAYRCLCREYFVKANAVALMRKFQCHESLSSDIRPMLEEALLGHSLGLEGLKYHKSYFDKALHKAKYDEFEFTYFTSKSPCNIQLSGLLYPDYDFLGMQLQDLRRWETAHDLITFFTAPTCDGWAFGFAWHASSSSTCIPFIQSLGAQVAAGKKLEDVLLRLSFSCCENHAFRISWWDNLSTASKEAVLERMLLMVAPEVPVPADYLHTGCEGIADWSFEHVHTTLQTG